MTEEIIIDGVNINNCDLYCSRGYCMDDNISPIDCKDRPDCLYKQLIRLEQERNEWKKKYEDVANENLKEIYELIKKNDCWRGVVNVVCGKLEQENKENIHYLACMTEQRNKLKSALEEIKVISDNYNLTVNKRRKQIADKINEVLGNENNNN